MSTQQVYKALADPTRRQILKLLQEGELPAGEIAEQFTMTWPSVSRHLGILADAGLVAVRRDGQHLQYSLTTSVLTDIVTELADIVHFSRSEQPATEGPSATRALARRFQ